MIIGIVIDTEAKTADIYDNSSDNGKRITLYNQDLYELVVHEIPKGIAEMYSKREGKK